MSKVRNIGNNVQDYLGKERVFISTINYQDCKGMLSNTRIIKSHKKAIETDKRIGLRKNFTSVPNMWISVNCVVNELRVE